MGKGKRKRKGRRKTEKKRWGKNGGWTGKAERKGKGGKE